MSTLEVTVKEKIVKGLMNLEGYYQLPGSTVTKLARKDGSTSFVNRATLNQTANRVANAIGWKLEYNEPAKKVAAKKSVKAKTVKNLKAKSSKVKSSKTQVKTVPSSTSSLPSM